MRIFVFIIVGIISLEHLFRNLWSSFSLLLLYGNPRAEKRFTKFFLNRIWTKRTWSKSPIFWVTHLSTPSAFLSLVGSSSLAGCHRFKSCFFSDRLPCSTKTSCRNGRLLLSSLPFQPKPDLLLAWSMLILSIQFKLQVKMVYHWIIKIKIL